MHSLDGSPTQPSLLRFSLPIASSASETIRRYDAARGVSQVLQNGRWVDRLDVLEDEPSATFETRVKQETTDDS